MTEQKEMRLSLAAKKLNVGLVTIVEKLAGKGIRIENNPNAKLNSEQLNILSKEFNNFSLFEDSAASKPPPIACPCTREIVVIGACML